MNAFLANCRWPNKATSALRFVRRVSYRFVPSVLYVRRSFGTTGTADDGEGSRLGPKEKLQNWHAAVAKVPLSSILPLGFGGTSYTANIAAFYGDKRIGFQVALNMRECISAGTREMSLRFLTDLQSEAISNQMFASRLADILPLHVTPSLSALAEIQTHDAGTMVEAAVDAVYAENNNEAAVSELASFLVAAALQKERPTNAKGHLLQHAGGMISSVRLPGFPDHAPRFAATAKLGDLECSEEGGSKILAEQAAASMLLQKLGYHTFQIPNVTRVQVNSINDGIPALLKRLKLSGSEDTADDDDDDNSKESLTNDFCEVRIDLPHLTINLWDGETAAESWHRKALHPASAFYRAKLAPHVFPDYVATVDAWLLCHDNGAFGFSALMAVVGKNTSDDTSYGASTLNEPNAAGEATPAKCFLRHGTSKTKAKAAVALAANQYIANELLPAKERNKTTTEPSGGG